MGSTFLNKQPQSADGTPAEEVMESVNVPLSDEMKLSSGPIEKLPDSLLTRIFSYLSFEERYQLCFVTSKWAAASRIPWTDVTFLNLNSIPRAMVNPILGLCPNVKTVEAADLIILLEKKQDLAINENVQTMKLRNAKFGLTGSVCGNDEPSSNDVLVSFLRHFKRFPKLHELVLHNLRFAFVRKEDSKASKQNFLDIGYNKVVGMPDVTAASLRRLVVTASATNTTGGGNVEMAVRGMENLECVYLEGAWASFLCGDFDLPQLRELCVIGVDIFFPALAGKVVENKYPKLEVFICSSEGCVDTESVSQLINVNLALRILVIAGSDWTLESQRQLLDLQQQSGNAVPLPVPDVQLPVTLPARKLLSDSNAANQSRLPLLHIFVGGDFTKYVRFTLPKTEAANFWRIDCPMLEYLAKPEVAEIFEAVFVAKIIREGPANGLSPWGHPDQTELFFSTEPLLFY